MRYIGNKFRTQLHSDPLPDGELTPRQRALADAVRNCDTLWDFASAPCVVTTSVSVCAIPLGMSETAADLLIQRGLDRAEAELARLRKYYAMYGAQGFMPQSEPDVAPEGDFVTRRDVVVAVMQQQSLQGRRMTRAGSKRVLLDASRSYVLEGAETA